MNKVVTIIIIVPISIFIAQDSHLFMNRWSITMNIKLAKDAVKAPLPINHPSKWAIRDVRRVIRLPSESAPAAPAASQGSLQVLWVRLILILFWSVGCMVCGLVDRAVVGVFAINQCWV